MGAFLAANPAVAAAAASVLGEIFGDNQTAAAPAAAPETDYTPLYIGGGIAVVVVVVLVLVIALRR